MTRDRLTREERSAHMARIRGRDTKPEIVIRRGLHRAGLRYRLHRRDLPGCPDIIFNKRKAVIFVHGCFWHGHDCPAFKIPATRPQFWKMKISQNRDRDARILDELERLGWRSLVVWECAMRGTGRLDLGELIARVESWVRQGTERAEIAGYSPLGPCIGSPQAQ